MQRFLALETRYQKIVVFMTLIIIMTVGFYGGDFIHGKMKGNLKNNTIIDVSGKEKKSIIVNIKGAVEKPGIYEFTEKSRLNDVIQKAIPLENANLLNLNLAMFLSDEQDIYVPYIEKNKQDGSEVDDGLISINSSDKSELEMIPGIGKVMAQEIISFRENNGGFTKLEDLLDVSGIGDKTLDKMRPYIKL